MDKLWWPLEYILNTPSHHRVHHGRNEYCIDKNYAAVLIIWDRMFGTFAAERDDEPVVYGLVSPIQTYDPIEIQCKYYKTIFQQLVDPRRSFKEKYQLVFYGPGSSRRDGTLTLKFIIRYQKLTLYRRSRGIPLSASF